MIGLSFENNLIDINSDFQLWAFFENLFGMDFSQPQSRGEDGGGDVPRHGNRS